MSAAVQRFIGFLGRVCLSLIFIISGILKFFQLTDTTDLFIGKLSFLQAHAVSVGPLHLIFETMLSWSSTLVIIAAIIETLGGLLMFFGIKARFGAFMLLLFLIPSTYIFHNFWLISGPERHVETIMFLKNSAIMGGLLLVLAYGTGPRRRKSIATEKKGD